jgi:outer membrane protein TolC
MIQRCFWIPVVLMVGFVLPGYSRQEDRSSLAVRLTESVPEDGVSDSPFELSLADTVERAIRNNLATITATQEERVAAARRLEDLAELLPTLEAYASTTQQQTNLAAFGFSGFPGVPKVIGPFGIVDLRATLSQTIVDLERRHALGESSELERAASWGSRDVRERVILVAVDLYFQAVSAASRVEAVEAQVARAEVLHERALDLNRAGVVPGIDVLRAAVELRTEQQRLIEARNAMLRQELALGRAIGLPLAQEIVLVDELPSETEPLAPVEEMLERAYDNRSDLRELDARVRAAQEALAAVKSQGLPTLTVHGDYGVIGRAPGDSHGTYSLRAEVRVPLFDRSISAQRVEDDALLREREAERESLRGRVEYEVRSAVLDVESALDQLAVARESRELAVQQLEQAQNRFTAGVANNLEVVQAQESVALAEEGVIRGLYTSLVAGARLARATGTLEQAVRRSFGSATP